MFGESNHKIIGLAFCMSLFLFHFPSNCFLLYFIKVLVHDGLGRKWSFLTNGFKITVVMDITGIQAMDHALNDLSCWEVNRYHSGSKKPLPLRHVLQPLHGAQGYIYLDGLTD